MKTVTVDAYLNFKLEARVSLSIDNGRKVHILTMEEALALLSDLQQEICSVQQLLGQKQAEMLEAN